MDLFDHFFLRRTIKVKERGRLDLLFFCLFHVGLRVWTASWGGKVTDVLEHGQTSSGDISCIL